MATKQRRSDSHRSKDASWRKVRSARVSRRKFIHMAGGAGALWALGAGLPPRAFAQAAKRGGTLRVATTKDAEVLDPSNIVSDVELRLCEQLFNGLVSIDENLNIVPDIAEEWAVTNDATHFEFKLRRGRALSPWARADRRRRDLHDRALQGYMGQLRRSRPGHNDQARRPHAPGHVQATRGPLPRQHGAALDRHGSAGRRREGRQGRIQEPADRHRSLPLHRARPVSALGHRTQSRLLP